MTDLNFQCLRSTLAVACHLHGEVLADDEKSQYEVIVNLILLRHLLVAGETVGKDDESVVGGGVTVDGNHVKGIRNNRGNRLLQKCFVNVDIGGHNGKHGRHVRMNHAGTLAHTAEGNLYVIFGCELAGNGLADGVRRHNCFSGILTVALVDAELLRGSLNSGNHNAHGHRLTDNARGSRKHLIRIAGKRKCGCGSHLVVVFHALLAHARIGDTGVQHNRMLALAVFENFHIPRNRRSLHPMRCKRSSCHTGCSAVHKSNVLLILLANPRHYAACGKSLRGRYISFEFSHIAHLKLLFAHLAGPQMPAPSLNQYYTPQCPKLQQYNLIN